MKARQARAPSTPYQQLVASGLGYLEFARANPALFRLIFGLEPGAAPDPDVMAAAASAFMVLASSVAALHGAEPLRHPDAYEQVMACWTRVHGFAELLLAGHIHPPPGDDPSACEALFVRIFETQFGAFRD
jgi:hypothetical protein